MFMQGPDFHFEISEVEIARVNCIPGYNNRGGACGLDITKTYLYNFNPLKPHVYIVKLGFTGVYIIFLISTQNHRLWVLVSNEYPQPMF